MECVIIYVLVNCFLLYRDHSHEHEKILLLKSLYLMNLMVIDTYTQVGMTNEEGFHMERTWFDKKRC